MAVILSLGTIVNVDIRRSVAAFESLMATSLNIKINIPDLIKKLQPIFLEFNLGVFVEKEFQQKLLEACLSTVELEKDRFLKELFNSEPSSSDLFKTPEFNQVLANKEQFIKELQEAWNKMVSVDEQAISLMRSIVEYKDSRETIVIYSDTNETNFNYLKSCLDQLELGLVTEEIQTTFQSKKTKAELVKKLVNECKIINPDEKCVLVVGCTDSISNETLRTIAKERDDKITIVAAEVGSTIIIEKLAGPRLTLEKLKEIITSYKPKQEAEKEQVIITFSKSKQELEKEEASCSTSFGEKPRSQSPTNKPV
jgi:hypothetical protein